MIPSIFIKIALLIILARSGYVAFTLLQRSKKNWLDILFYLSVALLALDFII